METKRKSNEMEWLRSKWGFDNCLTVDYRGRGGGLAILWLNSAQVEILSFSNIHIDARIGQDGIDKIWRFTGFYGCPEVINRHRS